MRVLYQPQGRAREYSSWAVSSYKFCEHACSYCYVPEILRVTPEEFSKVQVRPNFLEYLEKDCLCAERDGIHIPETFLCFSCDPYPGIEAEYKQTRGAIEILHKHGISVRLLTKAGVFATRDFDLLTNKDWFGCTLTFSDYDQSKHWEPNAALPNGRIDTLQEANQEGISTWVSLEPVIDPEQTLKLINACYEFVDHWKVGKLNYHPLEKTIDWKKFAHDVVMLFNDLECDYYIKDDLRKYLC